MSRTRQLLYVIVVAVIAVGVVAIPASGKPHTSGKPHKVKKASEAGEGDDLPQAR